MMNYPKYIASDRFGKIYQLNSYSVSGKAYYKSIHNESGGTTIVGKWGPKFYQDLTRKGFRLLTQTEVLLYTNHYQRFYEFDLKNKAAVDGL